MTCYNMNYFVSQPVGLDFTSGSGFCQWVWILPVGLDCQWVWIWKPHGPDCLLYHVIYTQPWHNGVYPFLTDIHSHHTYCPSVYIFLNMIVTKSITQSWHTSIWLLETIYIGLVRFLRSLTQPGLLPSVIYVGVGECKVYAVCLLLSAS